MSNTAASVLAVAAKQVGYSRWTDPQQGSKYGRWYAQYAKNSYYGANGVPYCAMFVSWVFNQAAAKAIGLPGAYCPTMLAAAKRQNKTLTNIKNAMPGDIVFFDWGRDGVADHVGIVEKNCGSYVQTIEGNTSVGTAGSQSNGGVVARRTRAWSTICGVVRPDYTTTTATSAVKVNPAGKTAQLQTWLNKTYNAGLTVDNSYGPLTKKATVKAIQTEINRSYGGKLAVDGSYGPLSKAATPALVVGSKGNLVRIVQGLLGVRGYDDGGFDGEYGAKTKGSVQAFQKARKLVVDGSACKVTISALLG